MTDIYPAGREAASHGEPYDHRRPDSWKDGWCDAIRERLGLLPGPGEGHNAGRAVGTLGLIPGGCRPRCPGGRRRGITSTKWATA